MLAGASQVHWWQLLTKDQRPLTMYPPSRSTARPAGAKTPLATVSTPPVSRAPSVGKKEWSAPAIAAVQRTPGRRTIVPGELLDGCEHRGWIHFEPTEVPRSAEPEEARFRQCLRRRGRQAALTLAFLGCLAESRRRPGVLRRRACARARPASPRPAVCSMQRRSCSSFAGGGIDDRRDRVDGGDRDADAVRVLADRSLVLGDIHAVDLVARHVAVEPLQLAVTCQRVPRSSWRRRCVPRRRSAIAAPGSTRSITNLGMVGRSFRSMVDASTVRVERAAPHRALMCRSLPTLMRCSVQYRRAAYTKACS